MLSIHAKLFIAVYAINFVYLNVHLWSIHTIYLPKEN